MAHVPDGALHQKFVAAFAFCALVKNLLHLEGNEQVAQRVQRHHRHIEVGIGRWNPAQAVAPQPVGVKRRLDLENACVEGIVFGGGGRARGVDFVGQRGGVQHVQRQHAVDGAVSPQRSPDVVLVAGVRPAFGIKRPRSAAQVHHDIFQLVALGVGLGRVAAPQRRPDGGRQRFKIGHRKAGDRNAGQLLGNHLVARKIVEQFGVAQHATHRHGACVLDLVDGGCLRLGIDRGRRDVPAHRYAGDEYLGGRGKWAVIGRRNGRKIQGQCVGVFHPGTNVVVVFRITRRCPGIAFFQQITPHDWRVHRQAGPGAPVAMGPHHQLAVPACLGHFDAVGSTFEHAGPAIGVYRGVDQRGKCGLGRRREHARVLGPGIFRFLRGGDTVSPATGGERSQG